MILPTAGIYSHEGPLSMDKLPQLTAEELDMCQQTFRSFDKDGALAAFSQTGAIALHA